MAIASLTYNHYSNDITIQYGTLNNPYIYKHLFLVTSKKIKEKDKTGKHNSFHSNGNLNQMFIKMLDNA
jgi:hypothetical protein